MRTPSITSLQTQIEKLENQVAKLEAKKSELAEKRALLAKLDSPENRAAMRERLEKKRAELARLESLVENFEDGETETVTSDDIGEIDGSELVDEND